MKKQQIQQQIQRKTQMTAYQKETVHDIFLNTIEWIEKYIELTYKNEFPDWEKKKQIWNINITRKDIYENPKKAEEALASQLHLFALTLEEDTSVEFEKELKQEFYKWISAVGIDINNCPERLKHFIFGLNELFEGNYEKIRQDIANRKREVEMDSPEYMDGFMKVFARTQASMRKEVEIAKSMEGKNPDEIKFSNFGSGDSEQGEQIFKGIASSVTDSHGGFYFKQQKGQTTNPQQLTNSEIIQDVRQNPQNWRLDEIIIDLGENRQENVLIHRSARLDDYNQRTGKLNFEGNSIYRANRFVSEEQTQINQALNISQQSTQVQQQTSYQWKWQ